ncbi:gastric triacylglycerol lipase [Strongylocentrotus purpuratus]|uniref:Partial AB-hydrolase lipase domain-containing protein n=1 Tax=Strongylocentrotus purpuratus TaxID=7668 RepID=A0A7M7NF66_STRPU|nr:gastric triacylglycerol lipase [Strongylocentrotus purpuratus]
MTSHLKLQATWHCIIASLLALILAAEVASSKTPASVPFRDASSIRRETTINTAAKLIDFMKSNRPQNSNSVHLSNAEVDVIRQRIRSSDVLDDLRKLSKTWQRKSAVRSTQVPGWPWPVDPDVYYNMSGLIWSKGYPVEEYTVQTEDGYLLGLFRIPHGRQNNSKNTGSKPVVFLQHGLLAASTCWVENSASESLGFILADAGYDVWMGNMRGNTYSRRHAWLDPNEQLYWQFSWDQMAKYDIPALLNFALQMSGQSTLDYVGHSQGTLVAFTGFTLDLNLAKKVKHFFALGPVYTVQDIDITLKDIVTSELVKLLADVLSLAGIDEFLPNDYLLNHIGAQTVCALPETRFICEDVMMYLGGFSEHHLNASRLQVYVSNEPAGTSLQNMEHFLQMVISGKCQMYDYGLIGNLVKYNQTTPPEYHVGNLAVPVALFWGDNDFLADPQDVERLIPQIPHLIYNKEIKNFEHLDFIWAMDANKIVYNDILLIMNGKIPPH